MTEEEFFLSDRITKIRSIDTGYRIQDTGYISFSGGKDSTCLHYLIDEALPGNKIPRLFLNTGIEYKAIVSFVKEMAEKDDRIIMLNSGVNIAKMLKEDGYPFKSKEHSCKLAIYQKEGMNKTVERYLAMFRTFGCPKMLQYQFKPDFTLKVSDQCCYKLKKNPASAWAKENNKTVCITGMRNSEGGQRRNKGCIVLNKDKSLHKFHPLMVVDEKWENWYIKEKNIKLCELYYPPYNFTRTGCKGCPFNLKLKEQLETMKKFLPAEEKQCEMLWKEVYDEYRRLGYRL